MEITRAGSQPAAKGPGDWFTGTARIDPLFQAPAPARAAAMTHIAVQEQPDGKPVDWLEHVSDEQYEGQV